jgi:pyruvate/2-oxoacid:ferredoxin oxidoreductase beta subunit
LCSPCPTGWGYPSHKSIEFSRNAVKSNFFPLFEYEKGKLTLKDNKDPVPMAEFVKGIAKFKHLDAETIQKLQDLVNHRMNVLRKLAAA